MQHNFSSVNIHKRVGFKFLYRYFSFSTSKLCSFFFSLQILNIHLGLSLSSDRWPFYANRMQMRRIPRHEFEEKLSHSFFQQKCFLCPDFISSLLPSPSLIYSFSSVSYSKKKNNATNSEHNAVLYHRVCNQHYFVYGVNQFTLVYRLRKFTQEKLNKCIKPK